MHAFAERHGIEVIHAWGMTEMSPLGSVVPRRRPAPTGDEAWAYRYTQGRIPAGVEARIVGPDGERDAQRRRGGRRAGGPRAVDHRAATSATTSPTRRSSATAGCAPATSGVLRPDGFLTLTDRAKDVIKSGGEWISSVELENALMAHPAVLEACVVGVPDDRWGERPLATVVLREGATVTAGASCASSSAGTVARWQLPERWAFIEAVPKTSVGKFDKKRLRGSTQTAADVSEVRSSNTNLGRFAVSSASGCMPSLDLAPDPKPSRPAVTRFAGDLSVETL